MHHNFRLQILACALLLSTCMIALGDEPVAELPPAIAEVVNAYAAKVKEIQDRAREELNAERTRTIEALRALRDKFAAEGKAAEADLVMAEIRRLNAKSVDGVARIVAAPAWPSQWRGRVGESYFCELTGADDGGSAWGTDVYTDDSSLVRAAVHAGVLKIGETGVVKITIAAGQEAYVGSERNGITTSGYGSWGGSFKIERAKDDDLPPAPMGEEGAKAAMANPGTLVSVATRAGEVFVIDVTGAAEGSVWGSDVYTADSTLSAAAVHAGVLKAGERSAIKVIVAEGQGEYAGSTRNGVASRPWGSYSLSYRFASDE